MQGHDNRRSRSRCWRLVAIVVGAAAAFVPTGCDTSRPPLPCERDVDCYIRNMIGWVCLDDGRGTSYCAYRVIDCPTGLRWEDDAAKDLRGRCVRPEMLSPDGGADAPPPG
jgi:hypothetical protein